MTVHKLAPDSSSDAAQALKARITLKHQVGTFSGTIVKARALQGLGAVAGQYPIYRLIRCAARGALEELFDDLALCFGVGASRLGEGELVLDGPGLFVQASGTRKAGYCSCTAAVWGDSKSRVE